MPYPWAEDQCSYEAAKRLAQQIQDYWANAGFPEVRCRVVQFETGLIRLDRPKGTTMREQFAVRSNLVAGLPPSHPRAAKPLLLAAE